MRGERRNDEKGDATATQQAQSQPSKTSKPSQMAGSRKASRSWLTGRTICRQAPGSPQQQPTKTPEVTPFSSTSFLTRVNSEFRPAQRSQKSTLWQFALCLGRRINGRVCRLAGESFPCWRESLRGGAASAKQRRAAGLLAAEPNSQPFADIRGARVRRGGGGRQQVPVKRKGEQQHR
jgi:hypothetical protein